MQLTARVQHLRPLVDGVAEVPRDGLHFVVLRFGDEFEMTWASSLRDYNRQAPNMLLYWACMQRAIVEGVKRFNFGRCTPGAGTHRFKMQWGGHEEPLWWYGLGATEGATTPSPREGAFRFGPRIWRRWRLMSRPDTGGAVIWQEKTCLAGGRRAMIVA